VATGGLAKVILPECRHRIYQDDELLLKGLKIIYDKNC
jgi:type III pantothenate kinase